MDKFLYNIRYPLLILVVLWSVEIYEVISNSKFTYLGIYPRQLDGLKGILFAPLVHSDWGHLTANSAPIFVLTTIMAFFYKRVAAASFFIIYILTGFSVWLFARESYHIGASGVVYGLLSFVFWTGVFRRNVKSIILALIVLFFYQGMFMGIVPTKPGISWESHLLGAIVGIFTAFLFMNVREKDEDQKRPTWEGDDDSEDYFLNRDIFDMTREERRRKEEAERLAQERDRWFYESDST